MGRLKIHPVFRLLLGLSVLLSIGLLVQRGFHSRSRLLFLHPAADPRLVLKRATIVGWDLGHRLWKFSGDRLVIDHENHYLNYKGHGVGKLFFNDKPFLSILAPRLRYDTIMKNVEAFGGVRLYANPSTTLKTDALIWNQSSQHLYIPGKVSLESPYGSFQGHRLLLMAYEGQLKMSHVRMSLNCKVPPDLAQVLFLKGTAR